MMPLQGTRDRGLVIQPFVDRITYVVLGMRPQIAEVLLDVEWTEPEFVSAILHQAVDEFAAFFQSKASERAERAGLRLVCADPEVCATD